MRPSRSKLATLRGLREGGSYTRRQLGAGPRGGGLYGQLEAEGLLTVDSRSQRGYYRLVPGGGPLLDAFLRRMGIADLDAALEAASAPPGEVDRSLLANTLGGSKARRHATARGFVARTLSPLEATYMDRPLQLCQEGLFLYILEPGLLEIPPQCTVVVIENLETFRCAERIAHLLPTPSPGHPHLLVSYYPPSGDIARFLSRIPNPYIHFGDLDYAGAGIYNSILGRLPEERRQAASFLLPPGWEDLIASHGNPGLFANQAPVPADKVLDPDLVPLLDCIARHRRGYEQEGFEA